ncbi:MAG: redoxin family protein [Pirellulaceae bacterium]|nr:redoxin family protein [Pirellulaceae bacterium]
MKLSSLSGLMFLCLFTACSRLSADELLTVGSPAPELNIAHWFKQADGKARPVTKFQPGKIYVVEFWATWCGPCLQGMPHLAELQREYAEKGVQIIGVSSEELEVVQEFLAREAPQRVPVKDKDEAGGKSNKDEKGKANTAKPQTFGEVTSAYSLTCDTDESTEKAYMQAAFQSTIPTAFIGGKEGRIEWIGHPGAMDDVLRAVVSGTWDRAEFGKQFLAGQQAEIAKTELNGALQRRDFAKAVELIDKRLSVTDQEQEQLELRLTKIQISLAQNNLPEATSRLQECFSFSKGRVDMVDLICWHIYEQSEQRKTDLTPLVKVAFAEGEKTLSLAKGEALASLLDTVGHLAYKLGNKAKAIQLVTQATELAVGENKEFSKQFLQQLKAAGN